MWNLFFFVTRVFTFSVAKVIPLTIWQFVSVSEGMIYEPVEHLCNVAVVLV